MKLILKDVTTFKIKCSGISLKKDNNINKYYIFLNIVEGKELLLDIHNRIYSTILKEGNIVGYEPHITLGTLDSKSIELDFVDIFESDIDSILVESIGENEKSNIEFEINLNKK